MGKAKQIRLDFISKHDADIIIKKYHYSGKVKNNSKINIGVFHNGFCEGALEFGPSNDKRKMITLVKNTKWNEFIELNRFALSDNLPRNSESRCISIAIRMIKKHYPFVRWIISFADACQCGDGTIYRAAGFNLIQVRKNLDLVTKDGVVLHTLAIKTGKGKHDFYNKSKGGSGAKFKPLRGYQIKYIKFLDKSYEKYLTVPILPYSTIKDMGAKMYKGIAAATTA